MNDYSENPKERSTKENIRRIEASLDAALEHASHMWAELERSGEADVIDKDMWPPEVRNPVGSVPYHGAATIAAILRAYNVLVVECDRAGVDHE